MAVADDYEARVLLPLLADRLRSKQLQPRHFLVLLGLTKLADASTTIVGLAAVPSLVEANPALRALIEYFGLGYAVLLGSLVVIGLVWGATELGTLACNRLAPEEAWAPPVLRVVGYLPISLVFLSAAVHNALLILASLGGIP